MQTHVSEGHVDFDFLAEAAGQLGADETVQARLRQANTARHVQMILRRAGLAGLEAWLAQQAAEQAFAFVEGAYTVEVYLYDINGELLATAKRFE
jgi:cobalt-precorrin-5B (C1)-methyltransferase